MLTSRKDSIRERQGSSSKTEDGMLSTRWPWLLLAASLVGLAFSVPLMLVTYGVSPLTITGYFRKLLKIYAALGPAIVLFLVILFAIAFSELLKQQRRYKESLEEKRKKRRQAARSRI